MGTQTGFYGPDERLDALGLRTWRFVTPSCCSNEISKPVTALDL